MLHTKCMNKVYIDISPAFMILSEVNRSPDQNLNTVFVHIHQKERLLTFESFHCTYCNEDVTLDDIVFTCRCCNKKLTIDETFVPSETNGSFCTECCDNMFDDETLLPMRRLLSVSIVHII
jgi:hypothetical protein